MIISMIIWLFEALIAVIGFIAIIALILGAIWFLMAFSDLSPAFWNWTRYILVKKDKK